MSSFKAFLHHLLIILCSQLPGNHMTTYSLSNIAWWKNSLLWLLLIIHVILYWRLVLFITLPPRLCCNDFTTFKGDLLCFSSQQHCKITNAQPQGTYFLFRFCLTFANLRMKWTRAWGFGHSSFLMISKLWFNCVNTSTTEQEKRACSDVCWNCNDNTTIKTLISTTQYRGYHAFSSYIFFMFPLISAFTT